MQLQQKRGGKSLQNEVGYCPGHGAVRIKAGARECIKQGLPRRESPRRAGFFCASGTAGRTAEKAVCDMACVSVWNTWVDGVGQKEGKGRRTLC